MATRDLTREFRVLRDRAVGVHRRSASRKAKSSTSSLLTNDSLLEDFAGDGGDGGSESSTFRAIAARRAANAAAIPPWLKIVDQVRMDISSAKQKSFELEKLHAGHLKTSFDDDESEQRIEILTADCSRLLQRAQGQVMKLNRLKLGKSSESMGSLESGLQDGPGSSAAEEQLKANVTKELAAELQKESQRFRKKQKSYLTKLRKQATRAKHERDDELGALLDDSGIEGINLEDFTDKGMTNAQLQVVRASQQNIDKREKEMVGIARSIEELASLFKDMSMLVVEQGTILDRIDYNMEMVVNNTEHAVTSLREAADLQKKYRTKMCMFLLCILVLVMTFVVIIRGAA